MPYNNKIVTGGGETLIDLTGDTVTAAALLSGVTAHDAGGAPVTGEIQSRTAADMTVSGAAVTAPAGYYASAQRKSVAAAAHSSPTASIDSATGVVTASHTQETGYVAGGTTTGTLNLTAKAAQTYLPAAGDQTIAAGQFLTGAQTISGDANLAAGNIRSGVSIFGVTGMFAPAYDGSVEVVS